MRRAHEAEGCVGEGNRRRQPSPTGQREGERERGRGRAGVRLGWAELGRLGCFGFFLFPGISICFSISFSLGFSIQIQIKFQIQTNSNMCNSSKDI
jgi:hypothetical protein